MNDEVANSRIYEIYNHLLNLALNRFTWTGLPLGLTSEQVELLLITHGQLMFYKNKNYGNILLPCMGASDVNVVGMPVDYVITSENGEYTETISADEGVVIRNNPIASPDLSNLEKYAYRIDALERTQDVNIFQQNIPKMVLGDKNSELTMKNVINKIRKYSFVIFGKKTLANSLTTTDILDTSCPYVTDKLQVQKDCLMNEVLTFLGIENANTQKRERLITDEVNANNQFTNLNLDLMFDLRKRACDEIKEKFGYEIQVQKRRVDNGRVYSNIEAGNGN